MQRRPQLVLPLLAAFAGALLLAAVAVSPARAQHRSAGPVISAFVGPATDGFVALGFAASFLGEENGWVFRGMRAEEFELFGPDPALAVWDLSLQRALILRHRFSHATLAAGPALVGGMNRGRFLHYGEGWFGSSVYEEDPFLTAGLVGSVDLTLSPFSFLGVGVDLAGNLNPVRSYASAAVRLSLGDLR